MFSSNILVGVDLGHFQLSWEIRLQEIAPCAPRGSTAIGKVSLVQRDRAQQVTTVHREPIPEYSLWRLPLVDPVPPATIAPQALAFR